MKKVYSALIFTGIIFSCATSYAATGDVAGNIYTTDILATVNGEPIESYNIGGKTAVIAEDLADKYYGFSYTYDDSARTLTVRTDSEVNPRDRGIERGEVGGIAGNIYETDIKVIFNGSEVPGYNIGGRTAVVIEDLGTPDGSSPNEDYGYTKYLCSFTWDANTRTVDLRTPYNNRSLLRYSICQFTRVSQKLKYTVNNNILNAEYDPNINFPSIEMYVDEIEAEQYILKPLIFEPDGEEVGLIYSILNDGYITTNTWFDSEKLNPRLAALIPSEKPSYDQVIEQFTDDEKYSVLDSIETDNYTCLMVLEKDKTDDAKILVVSARRSGGYCIVFTGDPEDERNEIELTDTDTITYISGPTAAPHGTLAYIRTELPLNMFSYD